MSPVAELLVVGAKPDSCHVQWWTVGTETPPPPSRRGLGAAPPVGSRNLAPGGGLSGEAPRKILENLHDFGHFSCDQSNDEAMET